MLHKIVGVLSLGIALGLSTIATDAAAFGGSAGGGHGGGFGGGGFHGGGLGGGAFHRGGFRGSGFHDGRFGPGFVGHGFAGHGFNRGFVRGRFFSPGFGWWGAPGYFDEDLCFARTAYGYKWACGY
jgi:hypothetical protein